eukprot:scaffold550_cov238-Pinguiococcus_pyrenoidosus.AAC.3
MPPLPGAPKGGTLIVVPKEGVVSWTRMLNDEIRSAASPRDGQRPSVVSYSGNIRERRMISPKLLSRHGVVVASYNTLLAKEYPVPSEKAPPAKQQSSCGAKCTPFVEGGWNQRIKPKDAGEEVAPSVKLHHPHMTGLHRVRWQRVIFIDAQVPGTNASTDASSLCRCLQDVQRRFSSPLELGDAWRKCWLRRSCGAR